MIYKDGCLEGGEWYYQVKVARNTKVLEEARVKSFEGKESETCMLWEDIKVR